MPKLPSVSYRDVLRLLMKVGYEQKRQSGSHMILEGPCGRVVVVPRHNPIKRGTLHAILVQAGMSVDEFLRHLDSH